MPMTSFVETPFQFAHSSATCAHDETFVLALHGEKTILLKSAPEAARMLAMNILDELAELELRLKVERASSVKSRNGRMIIERQFRMWTDDARTREGGAARRANRMPKRRVNRVSKPPPKQFVSDDWEDIDEKLATLLTDPGGNRERLLQMLEIERANDAPDCRRRWRPKQRELASRAESQIPGAARAEAVAESTASLAAEIEKLVSANARLTRQKQKAPGLRGV
jgi:hypothetical protein